MRLGVTGTVEGGTPAQLVCLEDVMRACDFSEFHHGDAVGVDAEAHGIAWKLRDDTSRVIGHPYIICHPPVKDDKRAFCEGADEVREPEEYLVRDQNIVNEIDVLIAVPLCDDEQVRSGTWATVRYARKRKCVLIIRIRRDGSVRFG